MRRGILAVLGAGLLLLGASCSRDGAGGDVVAVALYLQGDGVVTSIPAGINCPPTCGGTYTKGNTIRLIAEPGPDARFGHWGGNLEAGCGTNDECTILLDDFYSGEVVFQNRVEILQTGAGASHVTSEPKGIDCPTQCEAWFDPGTPLQLFPTDTATAFFQGWGGPCDGRGTCIVDVDDHLSVPAPFGEQVWRTWGDPFDQRAFGVSTYYDGTTAYSVVTGGFEGVVDLAGTTLTSLGQHDAFAAAFSAGGVQLWARQWGDTEDDFLYGADFDDSGDLWTCGFFRNIVDFGGGNRGSTTPGDQYFWLKLDRTDGARLDDQAATGGNSGTDDSWAVDIEAAGGFAYVAGFYDDTVNLGGGTENTNGTADAAATFARYQVSNGNTSYVQEWEDPVSTTDIAVTTDLALADDGSVFITGYFTADLDIATPVLATAGGFDGFVAKVDGGNGNPIWVRRFGGVRNDFGTSVAVDAAGDVYLAGVFRDSIDFGGGAVLARNQNSDLFLTKLNGVDGTQATAFPTVLIGGPRDENFPSMALDRGRGQLLLTGSLSDSLEASSHDLLGRGATDAYVLAFDPVTGSVMWSAQFGGDDFDLAEDIAVFPTTVPAGTPPYVIAGASRSTLDDTVPTHTNQGGYDLLLLEVRP